jgi:thiol-disulfide isomerase/thioredoxin
LEAALKAHKGRPVILHFWATFCPSCLIELPLLAELAGDAKRKGVAFLAVSLDEADRKGAERVGALLCDRVGEADWSTILKSRDNSRFLKKIVPAWQGDLPLLVAYDRELRIHRVHVGGIGRKELEDLIADLQR